MKKMICIFILYLGFSQTASAQWIVFDPAAETTRLIQLAKAIAELKVTIEQLENIRDLGDVLDKVDLEKLKAVKAYAPEEFQGILAALGPIQGANFERIMEAFDGEDLLFSQDEKTNIIYTRILEDSATQAGYAEASYNAATESLENIYSTRDSVSTLTKEIDRDVAGSVLQAETAAGVQELIKLQSVMANTQAQELSHKAQKQAKHVKAAETDCEGSALCEQIRAMAAGKTDETQCKGDSDCLEKLVFKNTDILKTDKDE